jgi:hypothetical protein
MCLFWFCIHNSLLTTCIISSLGKICFGQSHALCFFYSFLPAVSKGMSHVVHKGCWLVNIWLLHSCPLQSREKPLPKVRNTSDCTCYYHWTVLFDLVSCSVYVRFNERYSSDPKAESVRTSVRQCATVVLTQHLQSCPSCYHMLMFMYCLPRLFKPKKMDEAVMAPSRAHPHLIKFDDDLSLPIVVG